MDQQKTSTLEKLTLSLLVISSLVLLFIANHFYQNRDSHKHFDKDLSELIGKRSNQKKASLRERIATLENQMQSVGTDNAFGGFGASLASSRPSKKDGNWFLTGSVLYWKPSVKGVEYALKVSDSQIRYPLSGSVKNLDLNMTWGFQVGIGRNFQADGWSLYAEYTRFQEGESSSVSPSGCGTNSIVPLRGSLCTYAGQVLVGSKAKSQMDFAFNAIDFVLSQERFVSPKLALKPFFGVKTAWIDFEQVSKYCGDATKSQFCGMDTVVLGPDTYKVRESSDFWGIGPALGVHSNWFLSHGFSLYAKGQGSLLYGFFDVDHKETLTRNANAINLSGNEHLMVPTALIGAGLAYDFFFDHEKQHLGFCFGCDYQYWWRVNQMVNPATNHVKYDRYSEDMSLQGLTLRGRWDF